MIIGNGLIASLFTENDQENIIFFASGVSNSLETKKEEFLREENLIKKTITENPNKVFIYFSTCSIYDSSKVESQYVLHKLKMEQIITQLCPQYLIVRLSNAVGNGGNPNLLINYLVRSVKSSETINVHTKATRNFIDTEDIKNIVIQLIKNKKFNKIINIAYPENYTIIEILEILEIFFQIKPKLNLVKSGSGYLIDIPDVQDYFNQHSLANKETYLHKILEKYYSN